MSASLEALIFIDYTELHLGARLRMRGEDEPCLTMPNP